MTLGLLASLTAVMSFAAAMIYSALKDVQGDRLRGLSPSPARVR